MTSGVACPPARSCRRNSNSSSSNTISRSLRRRPTGHARCRAFDRPALTWEARPTARTAAAARAGCYGARTRLGRSLGNTHPRGGNGAGKPRCSRAPRNTGSTRKAVKQPAPTTSRTRRAWACCPPFPLPAVLRRSAAARPCRTRPRNTMVAAAAAPAAAITPMRTLVVRTSSRGPQAKSSVVRRPHTALPPAPTPVSESRGSCTWQRLGLHRQRTTGGDRRSRRRHAH